MVLTESEKLVLMSLLYCRMVLTESEKLVLMSLGTLSTQGVFDVAFHVGSLVCRILFSFTEEVGHTAWSQLMKVSAGVTGAKLGADLLKNLLKMGSCVGLIIAIFGPAYSEALLYLLYGSKWAPQAWFTLAFYCLSIPLLAVNGICEAFFRSIATPQLLGWYKNALVIISVFYLCTCYAAWKFLDLGGIGLILANCVNMLARIIVCLWFALGYFADLKKRENVELFKLGDAFKLRPHIWVALVLSAGLTQWSRSRHPFLMKESDGLYTFSPKPFAMHIMTGVACFGTVLAVMWFKERAFLKEMLKTWRGQTSTKVE
eukprot:gene21102-1168_t